MDPFSNPAGLTLESFLSRFSEVDEEANGYAVICPSHNDETPSLRVAYNAERKTLMVRCRVGCKTGEVVKALGLTMSALFNVEPGDLANVKSAGAVPVAVGPGHRAALRMYLDKVGAPIATAGMDHAAMEYAAERFGISLETAVALGLGYDEGSTPSGIMILSRELYRDTPRLVVPFNDFDGHAHYLQARALDKHYAGRAKWSGPVNPDGAVWGRYGWFPGDLGWPEIIVTEGPGDGLTTVGAGYDTLLIRGASIGLTDEVLAELVERFPDRVFVVAGDNDNGGQQFNQIVGERLASVGLTALVLQLPEGVGDISDWREVAAAAFYAAFTNAISSANPWVPLTAEAEDKPNTEPEASPEEDNLPHTELANARRLYARMKGLVRHTPALGFLLWNGSAWEVDSRNRVQTEAARSAEDLMTEALAMPRGEEGSPQDKRRKAALRWAHDSQRMRGLEAAVALLRALPGVAVSATDLDAHPDLLACRNGTVNLRTGELREADPADLLTKALNLDYKPDAPAARWNQFMVEVFPESPDTRVFLQRLVGYGITGENSEQCFVLLHGHGANGKSVFTSALFDVFAPITANTGIETFLASDPGSGGGPSSDVAALRGARLALTSESEHGARLAEARLKRLTGGDPVQARHLYREMFTFTPTFLLFMSTNGLPEIRGTDDGIWRRIKVLEWAQKFNGARRDTALPGKLRAEREGILAWAVRGAVAWYAARDAGTPNALAEPLEVTQRTDEYREQSDKLDGFYPGKVIEDEAGWIPRGALYGAYQEWAESEGSDRSQMWRNTTLYSHFRSLEGVRDSKRKGVHGFAGIRLAKPSELAGEPDRAREGQLADLPVDPEAAPNLDAFIP